MSCHCLRQLSPDVSVVAALVIVMVHAAGGGSTSVCTEDVIAQQVTSASVLQASTKKSAVRMQVHDLEGEETTRDAYVEAHVASAKGSAADAVSYDAMQSGVPPMAHWSPVGLVNVSGEAGSTFAKTFEPPGGLPLAIAGLVLFAAAIVLIALEVCRARKVLTASDADGMDMDKPRSALERKIMEANGVASDVGGQDKQLGTSKDVPFDKLSREYGDINDQDTESEAEEPEAESQRTADLLEVAEPEAELDSEAEV